MTSRLLYVTHRVPWPPDRGDRIRTWNVLKFLASRATVDLACLADGPVTDAQRRQLQAVTGRLAIVPHSSRLRFVRGAWSLATGRTATEGLFESPQLRLVVQEWSRTTRYSAVLASSSGVASYIHRDMVPDPARRWVDLIDVDSQKWLDYAAAGRPPMSWLHGLEGQRLRKLETALAADCERLLVVSEAERDLFRTFCPLADVEAVGNGVDTDYFAPRNDAVVTPQSCVFTGVMNYKPNVDGVVWFAEHVWPLVRQRFTGATLTIVGRSPTRDVLALAERPGITVTGGVPDVRPYLHTATCAVVPLRIARGVQNKVLEAMASGTPVICSPAPLQGLAAKAGLHLLAADSPDEWLQSLTRIFSDAALRGDLSIAGCEFVKQHHSWEQCLSPLLSLLHSREHRARRDCEVPG